MTERDSHTDTAGASQLSAMFDGQLPSDECDLLGRRLSRDPELRARWQAYALIGACLRDEPLRMRSLVDSVAAAIDSEPDVMPAPMSGPLPASTPAAAPAASQRARSSWWLKPVGGLALAAGVAAVAILTLRPETAPNLVSPADPGAAATAPAYEPGYEVVAPAALSARNLAAGDGAGDNEIVLGSEPVSYVVPPEMATSRSGLASAQLANYVVAHSAVSAPLSRRSLLSALVAADTAAMADGAADLGEAGAADRNEGERR